MHCRKCGSKRTTKRGAGIFFCQRCGMQPGQEQMDRAGNPSTNQGRKEDTMLAKLKERLSGGANRLAGRTDLLEAVCAAAALVASADGSIDDSEIEATIKAVTANEALNTAFDPRQIEAAINRQLSRADGNRVGRMNLYKEIDDIAGNAEDAEMVALTALDIADADGTVDPAEEKVLAEIGKRLGISMDKLAAV